MHIPVWIMSTAFAIIVLFWFSFFFFFFLFLFFFKGKILNRLLNSNEESPKIKLNYLRYHILKKIFNFFFANHQISQACYLEALHRGQARPSAISWAHEKLLIFYVKIISNISNFSWAHDIAEGLTCLWPLCNDSK